MPSQRAGIAPAASASVLASMQVLAALLKYLLLNSRRPRGRDYAS